MDNILARARECQTTYAISARSHHLAASEATKWNQYLGVPVTVASTIVGTSIFATINESPEMGWRIAAGILALLAALLSSLQTFFGYSKLAEQHKVAGTRYASIRRQLEHFELKYTDAEDDMRSTALSELEGIFTRLSELSEESPTIPDKVYDQAKKEFQAGSLDRNMQLSRERGVNRHQIKN